MRAPRRDLLAWAALFPLALFPLARFARAQTSAQTLTVAVDDSLGLAMQEVALAFEARHGSVSVRLVPGASGTLLDQLSRELEADVLVGTDAQTVATGVQRNLLVPDLRSSFASNSLVLVVPAALQLPVRRMSDLMRAEVVRIAIGREASVPVGRYAREAIDAQRLWPSLQRKLVMAASETEVASFVAAADVEAGFVYATTAAREAQSLRVVETLSTTTPIRYQANVVAARAQQPLAKEFVAFLRTDAARVIFKRLGYGPP
jgi:molybdate transport system substrate-binding protein